MRRVAAYVAVLLAVANALILSRILIGDVRISEMRPRVQYYLSLRMEADLHGESASIRAYLPQDLDVQTIETEKVETTRLSYSLLREEGNRLAVWTGKGVIGHEVAVYDAIVDLHPRTYALPANAPIPGDYPSEVLRYLEPTETVQSESEEIREKLRTLRPADERPDVAGTIRAVFDFVQDGIASSDYENTLDAVTTLRWGEAFCGGKSRLMVALLRAANIPARLVGGVILRPGAKRTTHVWTEAWVNGVWVPFDPLNRHFAEHPDDYLVLYRGDRPLFRRSRNINFQYVFNIKKWRTPPDEKLEEAGGSLLNAYVFWEAFRKAHISLNLLRIILLLPVGVLIVIFFRNVVGLTTFGTFHPALMAVAFRDTGLLWGAALYVGVLSTGMLLRGALERIQLLHTPRLAVVLTFVVGLMLGVSYLSARAGLLEAAHLSMFPIAILAITVESYFVKSVELGGRQAVSVMLQTLLVIVAVYGTLDSHLVQALVFVFPEVLLGVTATYLVLGRWVGMRLLEYQRFRWLLVE